MRIVYMGTPSFAALILAALTKPENVAMKGLGTSADCSCVEPLEKAEKKADRPRQNNIVAVYAQPDREAGRGKKLQEPQTKQLAKALHIPVFQPNTFRNNPEAVEELRALRPDVLVVAAYGMLLPQEVLDIPTFGAYNVHASLLPKYRGAAPVQRALIAGDKVTGISIMRMEAGLDTGPIMLQKSILINDSENLSDNTETLLDRLAYEGATLMKMALNMVEDKQATFVVQNDELSTHAPKLTKQEAQIDWTKSAEEIHNHIRGFSPNPGATARLKIEGKDPLAVRIEKGFPVSRKSDFEQERFESYELGQIVAIEGNYILVKTGKGIYGIEQIRLAGKPPLDAKAFNNGYFKNKGKLFFEECSNKNQN